ncbi:MAG: hypothetical protein DMD47_00105 [Gemmatimonadetes bacterium]|nr:MAG: hypothetical protein DMD47_00105 [Gemmatimonadota bacterium]
MRVALLLACVAAPLAGQSVRIRLENRVPAAAIPIIDSLVQVAGREGLPTEPLVGKALEGGAKHVVPALIVRAVETRLDQLRDARALLVRGGDAPPATPAEIATVSGALRRGLPPPVVERVVGALPSEPRESALHAIADLVAHRLDADSSATLVIAAIHAGLRGGRLLDVSHAVLEEQQRGRTWAESFVRVRDELPDVPAAPKPGEGTVQRARRPSSVSKAPTPL